MLEYISPGSKLMNAKELAEILGISVRQAYLLMSRGDIKSVRFGRLVRARQEDLNLFIEQHLEG